MEKDSIRFYDLTVRPFGTAKGVKDLKPVRLQLDEDDILTLKTLAFEARCSASELARAIVTKWLGDHKSDIRK